MIKSIVVRANPTLAWEEFALTFPREAILSPRLEHRDIGGYWKAEFSLHSAIPTRAMVSDFLTNGAMRHVEFFNEKGMLEWEGFINKIRMDTGTVVLETDLSNVFNRQWARYNSSGTITRSTKLNNTASQSKVGIKERVIVAGEVSLSVADQAVQQLLDLTSSPSPALREIRLGGRVKPKPSLEFSCLGYWHTFNWRTYNQTASSGDADASTIVSDIVTDMGEFVDSSEVDDNVTQLEQEFDSDRYAGEIIKSIAAVGDVGNHKWIAGMTDNQHFYYKQAKRPER